jgi:hypothetical protein
MAQPQPEERTTLDQVLKLVDKLTPEEQEQVRVRLNSKSKAERWQALFDRVQTRCMNLPPLTDEDIIADMKEIREELKGAS